MRDALAAFYDLAWEVLKPAWCRVFWHRWKWDNPSRGYICARCWRWIHHRDYRKKYGKRR